MDNIFYEIPINDWIQFNDCEKSCKIKFIQYYCIFVYTYIYYLYRYINIDNNRKFVYFSLAF